MLSNIFPEALVHTLPFSCNHETSTWCLSFWPQSVRAIYAATLKSEISRVIYGNNTKVCVKRLVLMRKVKANFHR